MKEEENKYSINLRNQVAKRKMSPSGRVKSNEHQHFSSCESAKEVSYNDPNSEL
jgi:hypothetical protein